MPPVIAATDSAAEGRTALHPAAADLAEAQLACGDADAAEAVLRVGESAADPVWRER